MNGKKSHFVKNDSKMSHFHEKNEPKTSHLQHLLQQITTVSRYKLKDYSEEEVTGSFFVDELVRYNPSEFYDIKVIMKRKTKRGVEYLVNFIGYQESMNQWVKASTQKINKKVPFS